MNYYPNFNYIDMYNNFIPKQPSDLFEPYDGFIRGNLFKKSYDPYKLKEPYEVKPINEQAKMLTEIDSLCFAIVDLNLYLDVFPNDKEKIDLFNRYREKKERLTKDYENKYGPITMDSDSLNKAPWAWNNLPWPWSN